MLSTHIIFRPVSSCLTADQRLSRGLVIVEIGMLATCIVASSSTCRGAMGRAVARAMQWRGAHGRRGVVHGQGWRCAGSGAAWAGRRGRARAGVAEDSSSSKTEWAVAASAGAAAKQPGNGSGEREATAAGAGRAPGCGRAAGGAQ